MNLVACRICLPGVAACGLLLAACNDAAEPIDTRFPDDARIGIVDGDGQLGMAGSRLPVELAVRVTARGGVPVQSARILWSPDPGTGSVTRSSWTNRFGVARATRELGAYAGPAGTVARVEETGEAVRFSALAHIHGAVYLRRLPGDAALLPDDTVLAALPTPLRVRVEDHEGKGVAGFVVGWASDSGSIASASSLTDAQGVAAMPFARGRLAGVQSARAVVAGLVGSPVTFATTAAPGNPVALVKAMGDGQVGIAGVRLPQPFGARVTDAHGNAVEGVTVSWRDAAGGLLEQSRTVKSELRGEALALYYHVAAAQPGTHPVLAVSDEPRTQPSVSFEYLAIEAPSVQVYVSDIDPYYCNWWGYLCGFEPAHVTIQAGQSVEWTWSGSQLHNVVFEDDPAFNSLLQQTGKYTRVFPAPGVYRYRCTQHSSNFESGMIGWVVVQP